MDIQPQLDLLFGGARDLAEALSLREAEWKRVDPDLLLTAKIGAE